MGYDYTGYGHADGVPSEVDCYADIAAVFGWLMQEKNLLPRDVILYGRSLGSGPTLDLASRVKVRGGVCACFSLLKSLSPYRLVA